MATSETTKTVEVWEQHWDGNRWQAIEGAAWDMHIREGETFRQACIRHGGDFDRNADFRLVVFGEDGGIEHAEVFGPGQI